MASRGSLALLAFGLTACGVEDGPSPAVIDSVRVLAVRAEPAEAPPGAAVRIEATLADADGLIGDVPIDWAWCATPKPPIENNAVAAACLADGVAPIGSAGLGIDATLPADGCRLFGPESPGPGLRPRDPDITGGYHQPIRLAFGDRVAFGAVRLRCNLAQAPLAVAQAFAAEYEPNAHPVIAALDGPGSSAAGATHPLTVRAEPPEDYLRFDPAGRTLETQRERLTVSWFATGGLISAARGDASDGSSETRWTAPSAPGAYSVIAVLRDSRGGVAVSERRIDVR